MANLLAKKLLTCVWVDSCSQVVLKATFQKIALTSSTVPLHKVVGPIMLALNVTADSRVKGSIGAAFTAQFKKCLTAIMREAKSSLVGMILDTLLMVHADIPPCVERVHEHIYEKRKALHVVAFKQLLAAPGGFDITEHPHMHSFHASIVNVGGVATVCAAYPLLPQGDTHMLPNSTIPQMCVHPPQSSNVRWKHSDPHTSASL